MKNLIIKIKHKIKSKLSIYYKYRYKFIPKFIFPYSIQNYLIKEVDLKNRLNKMLGNFSFEIISNTTKEEKDRIIFAANKTLENEFNILGSNWIKLNPLAWNKDLITDENWSENKFYLKQRKNSSKNSDIKFPWELSRGHYLLWLGEAYLITNNEKYALKIIEIINNWIDKNPFMYTVNWVCSMDVAIRAVNWIYAINMISNSNLFSRKLEEKIKKSLYQHGYFIWNNLEKSLVWNNNHYIADLVGLIYLGTFFYKNKRGKKWLRRGKKEFYKEINRQILPSGIHYEKSISYHRLVLEMTSYTLSMLNRTSEIIPFEILEKTQKMYNYVGNYLKPNYKAPLLADNDDGRFLPFSYDDNFNNHYYLLNNNSLDNKFINEDITPLFKYNFNDKDNLYVDAGIAILKKYGTYLLVNNSGYSKNLIPNIKQIGTHTHNDQLSFEFSLDTDDIIIDPGSYVYTSNLEKRNEFRSTRKHNTLIVDGEEQNLLSKKNAFTMQINNCNRKINVYDNFCIGSYETINGSLKHERIFEVSENKLIIYDRLEKKGKNHHGNIYFHLSNNLKIYQSNKDSLLILSNKYFIKFKIKGENILEEIIIKIKESNFSPSYGILKSNETIEGSFCFDEFCKLITTIEWEKK